MKNEKESKIEDNIAEAMHDEITNYDEEVEVISNEKGIKETSIILTTLDDATAEYISEEINGELLGIIIDSDKVININIYLDGYNNICLFKKVGFVGQKYLSLVNDGTYPDNEKVQNSSQRWFLNDKLKININGNYNARVKFVFRYK